jgi:hypothetical protein
VIWIASIVRDTIYMSCACQVQKFLYYSFFFLTRVNLKSPFVAKRLIYERPLKLTFVVVQTDSAQLVTVKFILNLW